MSSPFLQLQNLTLYFTFKLQLHFSLLPDFFNLKCITFKHIHFQIFQPKVLHLQLSTTYFNFKFLLQIFSFKLQFQFPLFSNFFNLRIHQLQVSSISSFSNQRIFIFKFQFHTSISNFNFIFLQFQISA